MIIDDQDKMKELLKHYNEDQYSLFSWIINHCEIDSECILLLLDSTFMSSLYSHVESNLSNIEEITTCLKLFSLITDIPKVKCLFNSTSINWFSLLVKISTSNKGNSEIENNILSVIYGLLLNDWNLIQDYIRDKSVIQLLCNNIMNDKTAEKQRLLSIKSLSIILSNDVTKSIDIISYDGLIIGLYNMKECKEGHALLTVLLQVILTNKRDLEPEELYIFIYYTCIICIFVFCILYLYLYCLYSIYQQALCDLNKIELIPQSLECLLTCQPKILSKIIIKFKCYNNIIKVIPNDNCNGIKVFSLLLSDDSVDMIEIIPLITSQLLSIFINNYTNNSNNQALFILFKLFTCESYFKKILGDKDIQTIIINNKFISKLIESSKDEKYFIFSLLILKFISILPFTRNLLLKIESLCSLISSINKENIKNINEILSILEKDPLNGEINKEYFSLITGKEFLNVFINLECFDSIIANQLFKYLNTNTSDTVFIKNVKELLENSIEKNESKRIQHILEILSDMKKMFIDESKLEVYNEIVNKNIYEVVEKIKNDDEKIIKLKSELLS